MKKVVVVGAGIAGLSAAIYAQRSGFEVTLCEQHSIVGGNCTSWKRKGYLFEGTVHWMTGTSRKTEVYQMWKDTGALNKNVKVYTNEVFSAIEWEGKRYHLYRNIEQTAKELYSISPEDEDQIRRLVKDIKSLSGLQMPVLDIKGVKSTKPKRMKARTLLNLLLALPVLARVHKMSAKDYLKQFRHPAIRKLISVVPDNYATVAMLFTLAILNSGDGGYPEGGSLAMTNRMAKRFKKLGGKLLLNTKVKKVVIEDGRTKGVMLDDTFLPADAVIVAGETMSAYDQLFEEPPKDAWLKELRENTKSVVCTFVSIGVRAELPEIMPLVRLDEPIRFAGKSVYEVGFNSYAGYEGYAPQGGTSITAILLGDTYDFWKRAKDNGYYEEEKKSLALQISNVLCKNYPQAEGKIEVVDVATPLTYERYTGAYHGSWMSVTAAGDKFSSYPGYSEYVKGLYFAGHRIMPPGGLPAALDSGRTAAQMVCRQFGVVFQG